MAASSPLGQLPLSTLRSELLLAVSHRSLAHRWETYDATWLWLLDRLMPEVDGQLSSPLSPATAWFGLGYKR